jgi:hypothetical protein
MKTRNLTALVFISSLLISVTAHAWFTEVLEQSESGGHGGGFGCISIDAADAIHIVSVNYSSPPVFPPVTLQYSTNASGSWETSLVVDRGWTLPDSVAVDSSDKVHFTYGIYKWVDYPNDFNVELKYVTNASGSWVTEDVDSGKRQYAFMALDSSDNTHIAYDDHATGELKYATNASGSWVTTIVDSGLGYSTGMYMLTIKGAELSVALDSSDKVHISYRDVTNEDLKYATNGSGSWMTTTVDSSGSVGWHTSVAVDSSDKVHISYYDATNDHLKHATNASGSWVTETVDSGLGYSALYSGRYTSIAIDTSDNVHIHYYDATNEELKYATNASGSWVIDTVESGLGVIYGGCRFTGMVLDSSGKAHISYLDDTNLDLGHATNASGSWATEIVPSPALMGGTSVALDSLGKAHVGYSGETVKVATDASGSWVTEEVDPVEGADISIAVDSSDKAHIGYNGGGSLKYATNASGSWVTTALGPGAGSISIALDGSGKAHMSFICSYEEGLCLRDDLLYGTNASGSWIYTLLESTCFIIEGPYLEGSSIAVDSLDKVHIAYGHVSFGYFSGRVMYATNRSGSWSKTALATGVMPSITVDSLDKLHITYVGNGGLMYATNRSGSWSHSFVAGGATPGIAVDGLDRVHISYVSSDRIMYATGFGSSWENMVASDRPPLGCGLGGDSIAVTSEGSVRIGHLGFDATLLLTSSSPCVDNDGDGYGDPATPECPHPAWDCDDTDSQVPSGLPEGPFSDPTCSDTLDNDCDGDVDSADSGCCECIDNDSDAYGDPGCENCTNQERDCDDTEPDVNPAVLENCTNGIDDDCDGNTDALDADCSSYSATANAEASMYGSKSVVGSGVFNELALLLIPVGALVALRILRRKRW